MKKIICISFLMLIMVTLAGCSGVRDIVDDEDAEIIFQSGVLVSYDYVKPSFGISDSLTILFLDGEALEFESGKLSEFNLFCEAHKDKMITVWYKETAIYGTELTDFKLGGIV